MLPVHPFYTVQECRGQLEEKVCNAAYAPIVLIHIFIFKLLVLCDFLLSTKQIVFLFYFFHPLSLSLCLSLSPSPYLSLSMDIHRLNR